jgi:hypothetical protein
MVATMTDQKCETCKFWQRINDWEEGNCRRYPPVHGQLSQREMERDAATEESGVWLVPITPAEWWCGEWQPPNTKLELIRRLLSTPTGRGQGRVNLRTFDDVESEAGRQLLGFCNTSTDQNPRRESQ